jgi:hypothetical protein
MPFGCGYTMSCESVNSCRLPVYWINFKSDGRDFTEEDKRAISNVVNYIGEALANMTPENDTPAEAFQRAFNLRKNERISFKASSVDPGYWGENTAHNTIKIYKQAKTDTEEFVAHELGHVFDNNMGQKGRNALDEKTVPDANGKKVDVNAGYLNPQRASGIGEGEYFADMFAGWVYGYADSDPTKRTQTDRDAGKARREWMNQKMREWLTQP